MDLELDSIYEGLVEYYINDYTIFEGILKRDFLEATGLLTEEAEKNLFQKIWNGIKKIFKIIIDKLKDIKEYFKDIISRINAAVFVKKYKKYYDAENGELEEFYYEKGFYKYLGTHVHVIGATVLQLDNPYMKEIIQKDIFRLQSEITDKSIMRKRVKDELIGNKESKYPFKDFKELKKEIGTVIKNLADAHEHSITKLINSTNKNLEDNVKEINHNIEKDIYSKEQLDIIKTYLEYSNIYKVYATSKIQVYCSIYLDTFKSYCNLYKSAGEYLKKKLKK